MIPLVPIIGRSAYLSWPHFMLLIIIDEHRHLQKRAHFVDLSVSCLARIYLEDFKPRDWNLKTAYHFNIWQTVWQQCCQDPCQISDQFEKVSMRISRPREFMRSADKTPSALWITAPNLCCWMHESPEKSRWIYSVRPKFSRLKDNEFDTCWGVFKFYETSACVFEFSSDFINETFCRTLKKNGCVFKWSHDFDNEMYRKFLLRTKFVLAYCIYVYITCAH